MIVASHFSDNRLPIKSSSFSTTLCHLHAFFGHPMYRSVRLEALSDILQGFERLVNKQLAHLTQKLLVATNISCILCIPVLTCTLDSNCPHIALLRRRFAPASIKYLMMRRQKNPVCNGILPWKAFNKARAHQLEYAFQRHRIMRSMTGANLPFNS